MRRNVLFCGALLTLAAMFVVLVGSAFDLNLESVALLGGAMGVVVALVPDRTPGAQLAGFVAGFVVAWAGYLVRAQFMPDTSAGRAVAVAVVVMICTAIAVLSADRLTLWTVVLGAGAFSGAYEFAYNQAPPEILTTSVATATTMAFNVAVGFLVGVMAAPADGNRVGLRRHGSTGTPGHLARSGATGSPAAESTSNARLEDLLQGGAR